MYFRDTDKVYLKNAVHLSWSLIFNLFQSLTDIFPIEECLADSSWYTIKPISCNLCPLKGQTYLNKPAAFSCYLRCHLLLYTRLGVIGRSGVGDSACSQIQIFIFLLKKIIIAPWPNIMLIIYYWQEIFLEILTSDSEAIL